MAHYSKILPTDEIETIHQRLAENLDQMFPPHATLARATARAELIVDLFADPEEPEAQVTNILTDLMHFATTYGVDFDSAESRARRTYGDELDEAELQD